MLLFASLGLKVRFAANGQVEPFSLDLHPTYDLLKFILQAESSVFLLKCALFKRLPVLEILERVNYQLTLSLHELELLA